MRFIVCIVLLLGVQVGYALSVEDAYKAIPHRQTVFRVEQSNLPPGEAAVVGDMLALAEKAMVERVRALKTSPDSMRYEKPIADILGRLRRLPAPAKLEPVREELLKAIEQHRAYFAIRGKGGEKEKQRLVQQSHRALIRTYDLLIELYPDETAHNRQAFYDYLCALDFI